MIAPPRWLRIAGAILGGSVLAALILAGAACHQEPEIHAQPTASSEPQPSAPPPTAPSTEPAPSGPTAAECEPRIAAAVKSVADPRDARPEDKPCCEVVAKSHDADAGASWDGDQRTYCCTLLGWTGPRACTP